MFHFLIIFCPNESLQYCTDMPKIKRRRPQKCRGRKNCSDERRFWWTLTQSYHKQRYIQRQKNTGKMEQEGKALHDSRTQSTDDNFLVLQVVNTDSKNITCCAYGNLFTLCSQKDCPGIQNRTYRPPVKPSSDLIGQEG
jgi:hypothetical protein